MVSKRPAELNALTLTIQDNRAQSTLRKPQRKARAASGGDADAKALLVTLNQNASTTGTTSAGPYKTY